MNCSGKHAAMLLACAVNGWDTATYLDPSHPLQQLVRSTLERLSGETVAHDAVDGCGAPLFSVSPLGIARIFRALVTGDPGTSERRVADAMRSYPRFVGGDHHANTDAMLRVPGLLSKGGAEGVIGMATADGAAVSMKILDGNPRATTLVASPSSKPWAPTSRARATSSSCRSSAAGSRSARSRWVATCGSGSTPRQRAPHRDDRRRPGIPRREVLPRARALVEICVDDLAGVLAAERAGADRVELCADLLEGGHDAQPRNDRVRPRRGAERGCADHGPLARRRLRLLRRRAARDAGRRPRHRRPGAHQSGAVGIVFGALTVDGHVDEQALEAIRTAAGGVPITFHKAFDDTVDLFDAYDTLAHHGIARVLTSGGKATAGEGADVLAALRARSEGTRMPTVLVGGSVRAHNVTALLDRTGAREVHLRAQVASGRGTSSPTSRSSATRCSR